MNILGTSEAFVTSISRGRLALMFSVTLVTSIGNTAMQSLLPATGAAFGVPDYLVSAAVCWSAILWVIFAPYWANRSAKRGRRFMMQLGLMGFVLSMVLGGGALYAGMSGLVSTGLAFIMFTIFRSLYGIFGAAAPPAAQAYVAARSAPVDRTRLLALIASSFGLGTVIGPAAAPYLVLPGMGAASAFFSFGLAGLFVMALLHFFLPNDAPQYPARARASSEPMPADTKMGELGGDDGQADDANISGGVRIRWGDKRLNKWFAAGLSGSLTNASLLGIMGFLVLDRLELRATPEDAFRPTGLVLTMGALATLFAQWVIIPLTKPRPRTGIVVAGIVCTVGVMILMNSFTIVYMAVGYATAAMGIALFRPSYYAGASLAVERHEQDAVAGQVMSINGMPWIFAPPLAVLLYGYSAPAVFDIIIANCLFLTVWGWFKLPKQMVKA